MNLRRSRTAGGWLLIALVIVLLIGGIRFWVNYQNDQALRKQLVEWSQPATPLPAESISAASPRAKLATRSQPATPLPPVSINSDCVGCDVAMPREVATPSLAMRDYGAPGNILLVTCSRGYSVDGHLVMGPPGSTAHREIVVQGLQPENAHASSGCLAITATYVGTEDYCRAKSGDNCWFGPNASIPTFKVAGEFTQLTRSQYQELKQYAAITK